MNMIHVYVFTKLIRYGLNSIDSLKTETKPIDFILQNEFKYYLCSEPRIVIEYIFLISIMAIYRSEVKWFTV